MKQQTKRVTPLIRVQNRLRHWQRVLEYREADCERVGMITVSVARDTQEMQDLYEESRAQARQAVADWTEIVRIVAEAQGGKP